MSGDSPNSHRNEVFDFKEGRQSPTPTTSKDGTTTNNAIQASIIVEPGKDKRDEEDVDSSHALVSPILNNTSSCDDKCNMDIDKTMRLDELSYTGKKKDDEKDEKKKLNGEFDKLDGVWVPGNDTRKKPVDDEDDKCVNCLYYTMQCCECTIV